MIRPITPRVYGDARGELSILIEEENLVYKRSKSLRGVARGLHIQAPSKQQIKFVRVVSGEILDICLNLDPASEKFGAFNVLKLDSSHSFMKVPCFYAHGFICLTDVTFEYLCLGEYDEESEVIISIPEKVGLFHCKDIWAQRVLSNKDRNGMSLDCALKLFETVKWKI